MNDGRAIVIRGEARRLPIPDASVDLIVTSPPYFGLRTYEDGGQVYDGQLGTEPTPAEYLANLMACTREWVRVLKPQGSIFVDLGDKYSDRAGPGWNGSSDRFLSRADRPPRVKTTDVAKRKSLLLLPERYRIACVDDLHLVARAVIVWDKPNAMPESVTDRVRRSHEDWVHLTKRSDYYADLDEIREPHAGNEEKFHPLGRLPGSVWRIQTEPLVVPQYLEVDHHAAFPSEWPRRMILGWCPADGVVLDPLGGTGTTAMVARALGRTGISVDLSWDYCRIARWRVFESDHAAKVQGRTWHNRQTILEV